MGADLYIGLIFKPNHRKWKGHFDEAEAKRDASPQDTPERKLWEERADEYFDRMYSASAGYFRDPYNSSSVLWQFGLSWWEDVIPMLDEECGLSVAKTETLLKMLHERAELFADNLAELPADEQQDFRDRANKLQMFLQTAIKLDCPIDCSL